MTTQDYITSTLKALAQPIVPEDIGSIPLEEAIYAKVMSKKFRKLKADDKTIAITKGAIRYAVKHNKPILVGLLFGGNKLWRFDEAPNIDWAELFSLIYYLRWMKSIASVYIHGAHFDYYSMDVCVESLNNVPSSETDQYSENFSSMLRWIKPYIPDHVLVTYRRLGDDYGSRAKYLAELDEGKKVVLDNNNGKLPQLDEAQKAATELNVKLLPGQNDDPLWRERVELQHQGIFETKTLKPYLINPTMIPTCPTPYPEILATGSTKKSIAKFWAGVGVLERSDDSYNELVLTPKQLAAADFVWEPVHLAGLTGKNFSRIRVLV